MVKNNIFLLLVVFLASCSTVKPQPGIQVQIQKVEVPIAVPCKATIPVQPSFNFDKLTIDNYIFIKNQALLADRLLHIGYETELLAALTSCVK